MSLFQNLLGRKPPNTESTREDPRRHERVVVVGLDLGTSGTKVVFRELTAKGPPAALDFGTSLPGFSRFSFPSTVATRGGKLHFGSEAEEVARAGGIALRSGKMYLLSSSTRRETRFSTALSIPPLRGLHPQPCAYEFAVACLLGQVLKVALKEIEPKPSERDRLRLLVNLDVPVDQLERSVEQRRFQRLLDCALAMSRTLTWPCGTGDALEAWVEALRLVDGTPADQKPGHVVGEAQAIMAGISESLETYEPYAVIDLGAGTTDIGIFRLSTWDGIERINFFAAGTESVGCDDIDAAVAVRMGASASDMDWALPAVRAAKGELSRGKSCTLSSGGTRLVATPHHLHAALTGIGSRCVQHYDRLWRNAYGKAPSRDQWERIGVVVVGGGSLYPALRERFAAKPECLRRICQSVQMQAMGARASYQVVGASSVPPTAEEMALLVVARGLSIPETTMRRLITPAAIRPIEPERFRRSTGLYDVDADDLYAK